MNLVSQLQDNILSDPGNIIYWLLYADYLSQYDIPQGELIILHFAWQEANNKQRLKITQNIHKIIELYQYKFNPLYWPHFQETLKDGSKGPEMSIIPAGTFWMGSPKEELKRQEDEQQHLVSIETPFAFAHYTTTFAEYDHYCAQTHSAKPIDEGWERGDYPVINLTWHDAYYYTQWLSSQTGAVYALPTEAQWEYACRAGTTTPFWFGQTITTNQANYYGKLSYNNSEIGEFLEKNVPVQSYQPNPWGLYQMHGNVWEYCSSCYEEVYNGSELLNISLKPEVCKFLAQRGGCSCINPEGLRSAYRSAAVLHDAVDDHSFRVTRVL